MKHTYDWQEEGETFWKWLVPSLISREQFDEQYDALSEATDRFTNVEIGVTINGIEIDAKQFFEGLDERLDYEVRREAKDMLDESERLNELNEVVYEFTQDVRRAIQKAAREHGIEVEQ